MLVFELYLVQQPQPGTTSWQCTGLPSDPTAAYPTLADCAVLQHCLPGCAWIQQHPAGVVACRQLLLLAAAAASQEVQLRLQCVLMAPWHQLVCQHAFDKELLWVTVSGLLGLRLVAHSGTALSTEEFRKVAHCVHSMRC